MPIMPMLIAGGSRAAGSDDRILAHRCRWGPSTPSDDDAAGGQHLLDHPQAEWEAEVQPDRVADPLGGKAIPGIGRLGGGWAHPGPLRARAPPAKPRPKLTVPSP